MSLTAPDRARVAAAIAAAEATTSGEIVCLLFAQRLRYPATAIAIAALVGLGLPFVAALAGYPAWALAAPDWDTGPAPVYKAVEAFLIAQLLTMLVAGALAWVLGLDRALTPAAFTHARLHRTAAEQFAARGLARTAGHTGVLIFASARDRYACVIADSAIHAHVGDAHWKATVAALTAGARAGDLAGGFARAVALAGAVLAQHFPRADDDVNELPDELAEI